MLLPRWNPWIMTRMVSNSETYILFFTNEIVEKSKSNVDALFATVTFDTRRNGLFSGDALQELDSVGKVLNDELLVSTSESSH